MFNETMRMAAATAAAILVVLTTTTAARADSALLKLVNNTSATIRFYVDGQASCSASPGSYCNDSTSVGTHTFYSRYEDSRFEPGTACEGGPIFCSAGRIHLDVRLSLERPCQFTEFRNPASSRQFKSGAFRRNVTLSASRSFIARY